jgi:hypothetical protein
MKPHRIVCVFLLLILAVSCQTTSKFSKVVIFYVPFQFTSNEAVTPENIKDKANSIAITDKRTLNYLDKLLAKSREGPGFDRKRVRLLIIMGPGDRTVWTDDEGNLLEANQERRLGREQFDQLQNLVSAAVATGGEMR